MGRSADHQLWVEEAVEAVSKSNAAVAIPGDGFVVLAAENNPPFDPRKIIYLDIGIAVARSGVEIEALRSTHDLQLLCELRQLRSGRPMNISRIAFHTNEHRDNIMNQGKVPPSVSFLIAGFEPTKGVPSLYRVGPRETSIHSEACAIGRKSNLIEEFVAKNYREFASVEEMVKLAICALFEVVGSPGKEIEVAVIFRRGMLHREQAEIDDIVAEIEAEKSAAKQRTENKQKKEQKATAC